MSDHLHHFNYVIHWQEHVDDRGAVTFAVWVTQDGQQIFYHHPCLHQDIAIEYARYAIDDINRAIDKFQHEAFKILTARIERYDANPFIDDNSDNIPF
jgi:hypothetical protein